MQSKEQSQWATGRSARHHLAHLECLNTLRFHVSWIPFAFHSLAADERNISKTFSSMSCSTLFHCPHTMLILCSGFTKSPPLDTYLVALAQIPWKGLQGAKKCSSGSSGSWKWRVLLTATSNKGNNNGHSSARAAHCHDLRPLRFNCRGHSRLVAELSSHPAAVQSSEAATELRPLHSEQQQIGSWFVSHSRWTRR